MSIRVAAVSWKLRHARSDGKFYAHMYDLISEAHEKGAELVVLPELTCLELLSLAPDLEEKDVAKFLVQFGKEIEDWNVRISHSSGMTLVGGSHFRQVDDGIVHASITATPDRSCSITIKNRLSEYEREMWRLVPGEGLQLAPDPLFGTILSSDCKFPEAWRGLKGTGAQVVCVPTCTETSDDFFDTRLACSANADANLVFAIHASLVGRLGYQPVMSSFGSSAILSPLEGGKVLDETASNEEGIAVAELDFEALEAARAGSPTAVSESEAWKVG